MLSTHYLPWLKTPPRKLGFSQITMPLLNITLRYFSCGLIRVIPLPSTVYIDPLLGSRSGRKNLDIMVILYCHHNYIPTTRDRDFILVVHVYLQQSHTLDVQGQGNALGSKVQKIKFKVSCYWEIFILSGMHVYIANSRANSILTCQGHSYWPSARVKVT